MFRTLLHILAGLAVVTTLAVLATPPALSSPYSDIVVADDPVAYWRLGESSTSDTANNAATGSSSVGASADGSYTGGVVMSVPGLLAGDSDTAIRINSGSTDRMATNGFEKFNDGSGGTGVSVEFWTRLETVPPADNQYANLVGDRESGGDFNLMVYAGNDGFLRPHVKTSGHASRDSAQHLNDGKIHHVVSTWERSTGTARLYIDGKPAQFSDGSFAFTKTGAPVNTDNAIFIGKDDTEAQQATAVLDEAAVYDAPLPASRVAGHYLIGSRQGTMPLPRSFWNFDESASGTGTAYDAIDGNHGAFVGNAVRTAGLIGAGAASFDNSSGAAVNVGDGQGTSNNMVYTDGVAVEAVFSTTWDGSDFDEIFRKEDGDNRILLSFQPASSISGYNSPGISFGINDGTGYKELDIPLDGLNGRPNWDDLNDGESIHHVVAAYDSDSGFKGIYLDGQLLMSQTVGDGTPMVSGGSVDAYIGNTISNSEPFTGVIDEVALYDMALPEYWVQYHWQNVQLGRDYFAIPEPGSLLLSGLGAIGLLLIRRRRSG